MPADPPWTPIRGLLTWSAPPAAILEVGSAREGEGARAGSDQAWGAEQRSASMGAPAPEQVCGGGRARPPPGRRREARWVSSELEPGTYSLGKVALRSSLPGLSLLICKTGFSVSCLLSSCYAMHSAVPPRTCLHFSISWGS